MKAVQHESDQVANELRAILAELEPLIEKRRELEQRAKALQTVMATYDQGLGAGAGIQTMDRRHFLDVAYEILEQAGPLYYDELLTRLSAAGITVPGRNPGANLIAHMTRDRRFKRVSRGTYSVQG